MFLCAACLRDLCVREAYQLALVLHWSLLMIIGVNFEKSYYSVCQERLRDFESFVIELGNVNAQEFINISLVNKYEVLVSILH